MQNKLVSNHNSSIFILLVLSISFSSILKAQEVDSNRKFFNDSWVPKYFNAPLEFTSNDFSSENSDVTSQIITKDSINYIIPAILGVNTTFRSKPGMATDRIDLYKNSGWKTFRFPAGSGSNLYFFDGVIPSETNLHAVRTKKMIPPDESMPVDDINNIPKDDSQSYSMDGKLIDGSITKNITPDEFVSFKKNVNGEATVVVNYFLARYIKAANRDERVLKAAKYAASFVEYMNITKKANIKYWEIGNEIYGKWEEGYYVDGTDDDGHFIGGVTATEYGQDFVVFANEMKKIDDSIKIGVVVVDDSGESGDNEVIGWNDDVMKEAKDAADFLVVHNYFLQARHQTAEAILASIHQIEDIKEHLEKVTEQNGKPRGHFPVAMTEFNIRAQVINGEIIENHPISMLSAIFTTEVIAEFIKNDYGMSTRWVGEWNNSKTDGVVDPYPEQKGTIAVNDPNQAEYTPRQAYMPYRYFDSYFGDYMISSTTDDNDVKVYASRFTDNKIGVVIVNETSTSKNVELDIKETKSSNIEYGNAYWYEINADNIDLENTRFYINGETATTPGGGPENFVDVKPFKSVFVNKSVFEAKKYSINFMVIEVTKEDLSNKITRVDNVKVYPNPIDEDIINIESSDNIEFIRIVNTNGMIVYTEENPDRTIDVAVLNSGMYILQIGTSKGISIKKISKM